MLHFNDEQTRNKSQVTSHKDKSNYVKRLNFDESIINVNITDKFNLQNGNKLIIDKNVADIPSIDKKDSVRKWIETHKQNIELFQFSPTIDKSFCKEGKVSPILGTKRKKRKSFLRNNDVGKVLFKSSTRSIATESNIQNSNNFLSSDSEDCTNKEEQNCRNVSNGEFILNAQRSPMSRKLFKNQRSPILTTYKRRRKKNNIKDVQSNSSYDEQNVRNEYTDDSRLPLILDNKKKDTRTDKSVQNFTSCKDQIYAQKSQIYHCTDHANSKEKKNSFNLSPLSETNIIIEDSPKHNENSKIEIASSKGSDSEYHQHVTSIRNDSDTTLDSIIEDIHTQDDIPPAKKPCISSQTISYTLSNIKSEEPTQSSKDSDETFFLEVEPALSRFPSLNLSDKISQATSESNAITCSKSNENNFIISLETPSPKIEVEPTLCLNVMNSGKKKRKPKKGSLAEKLQSLISRQVSFVRMWRHRMKQAEIENIHVPHVVIHVQKCSTRFNRHFLESIVLEDSFNLLENEVTSAEKRTMNALSMPETTSNRIITIMIVPTITGMIKLSSNNIVKIYPPWDVLDSMKSLLNVTYIDIVKNDTKFSNSDINITKNTMILKEYNCPCIEAGKILPSCERTFTNDKLDVMEYIYNSGYNT